MDKERKKKGLGVLLSVFLVLIVGLVVAIVVVGMNRDGGGEPTETMSVEEAIDQAEVLSGQNLFQEAASVIEQIDEGEVPEEDKQRFYIAALNTYLGLGDVEKEEEYRQKLNELVGDGGGGKG